MTRRLVGLGLLVAMAVLYVGITLPARRVRDESRAAFAQRREERERLRVDVARLERRASEVRVGTPDDAAAAARALRLSLLAATHGLGISDVQIASHPERRGTTAARGRLVGTGRQPDVLRTAGRLAHPDSGVLLERLELALRPEGIRMEADAVSVRAGSPPDDGPPHTEGARESARRAAAARPGDCQSLAGDAPGGGVARPPRPRARRARHPSGGAS